ncbi:uncharacterized protein LOC135394620 isoform X2 [Ornithodoros turicata]|uniref:uncharacterized protein LOC135394620 isoform X2 n=1 Tax=Ornithodoros turicata TaxID=34597 RepID=UPI003139D829
MMSCRVCLVLFAPAILCSLLVESCDTVNVCSAEQCKTAPLCQSNKDHEHKCVKHEEGGTTCYCFPHCVKNINQCQESTICLVTLCASYQSNATHTVVPPTGKCNCCAELLDNCILHQLISQGCESF